nr:ROK family transcriptional regulator [Pseudoponticoccus marisrubri]
MRARNEKLVLTMLRVHGPMAKSELARATGLSVQTVSVIMRALEQEGLLLRGEPVRGRVGQPSVPMRLAPDGAYFAGIKVGRRSVEMVLMDFVGTILHRQLRTHDFPTPDGVLDFVTQRLTGLLEQVPADRRDRMAGLGVAMPFFLWNWAEHLKVPPEDMMSWRAVDLQQDLSRHFDMPVYLQNDASAACGAEVLFGPQDGPRDFLYFYLGYFIGGGVVMNGSLVTGHGNAGALGPLPVPDGKGGICQLLERTSLSVLEARLKAAGGETDYLWRAPQDWPVDPAILQDWITMAADGLAHAIVSACAVFDFPAVRLDGWLPRPVLDRLIAATRDALSRQNLSGLMEPVIVAGGAGPDARALGAASLPLTARYMIG